MLVHPSSAAVWFVLAVNKVFRKVLSIMNQKIITTRYARKNEKAEKGLFSEHTLLRPDPVVAAVVE